MALIKAPDPAEPEYEMDVRASWGRDRSSATIEFRFSTAGGRPATEFAVVHERELHLIVVERHFRHFAHVHPVKQPSGSFTLDFQFPSPGEYMLFADFVPMGGGPQLLQRLLATPDAPVVSVKPTNHPVTEPASSELRVEVTAEELRAGTPALLTFAIADPKTQLPVTDLEPYLGAAAHLFITSEDFQDAAHGHPLEESLGPTVRFLARFARQGRYRAWLQTQHKGKVITSEWRFDVPAR
jgi:hypothetical protein